MSERRISRHTEYEGPAELLQPGVLENTVYDRRGMPGGLSLADRLTQLYGPEGVAWGVEAEEYEAENNVAKELHAPEFDLATEAFNNWLATGRYALNDGTDAHKLQRRVRQPDKVNVVLYPDAKAPNGDIQ